MLELELNKPVKQRLRRGQAARYLQEEHNLPITEKTLRNRNAAGLEPKPVYFGTIPFYSTTKLDEFAKTAFTPESPVTVTRRNHRQTVLASNAGVSTEADATETAAPTTAA